MRQIQQVAMLLLAAGVLLCVAWAGGWQSFRDQPKIASTHNLEVGGATIQVDLAEGRFELEDEVVLHRIDDASRAVAMYFGRFPVARARVLVIPAPGRHGVLQGTTWGNMRGFPGATRLKIGSDTTQKELSDDWMITHELTHMGFPSVADEHHWMEEGMATYVEPIARVQAGQLPAKTIWSDMVDGMPKGEPRDGDQGLDRTHTWGRTYWGGALFCLMADVEIRKQTKNRKGLQDALRGIVAAGGGIDQDWSIERAFTVGDQATGTHVLTQMYAKWGEDPVEVDLNALWRELGVRKAAAGVEFDAKAPLAAVREAITAAR